MNKTIFKSVGAIIAGFITVFVLSIVTDFVLETLGVFPPPVQGLFTTWMLMLALVYRCAYTVAGGYITAMLAPDRPMRHAITLGIIGIIAATLGAAAGWNLSQHWYPIALIVTGLPCTWLGGKLKTKSYNFT
ncbi:MAG: hypothetical protein OIN85_05150 [Candidatus Methanoperedens sp.]|nr:hypothetical protein [Candidatus Methanoperedens sp.]